MDRASHEKRTIHVRWKTTMVHGDDKTSPQTTPFVSRFAWRVSALVLVCLLACPPHRDEGQTHRSPAFGKSGIIEGGVRIADDDALPLIRMPSGRQRPDFFPPKTGFREAAKERAAGEALSQASSGGPPLPDEACSEAMHRSTNPRGNPPPGGATALLAVWAGRHSPPSARGFPPARRFS